MESLQAKFRVSIDGKDELTRYFADNAKGVKSFASTVRSSLRDTAKDISNFTRGMGRDLMAASGIKLGFAANARGALEFRDAIEQLVVSAGKGDNIIGDLKQQVWNTSTAFNQLGPDVVDALQAFVEKTGDIETARKNLALYAETATATRAAIKDVSLVGVELSDKMGIKDQKGAFAALVGQSKIGAIELKDLASYAPRVLSAAAAGGLTGEKGLREAGALTQVYAKAFGGRGGAASGSTSLENTFGDIIGHIGKIEKMGIPVRGRDQAEVLLDIIRKTGGDPVALSKIFNRRAIRGVNILANEYRKTGEFGTYETFRNAGGDYSQIQSDARRQSSTGIARLKAAQNAIDRASEENLGDTADSLAKHSNWISASYGAVTDHPFASAIAAAGGAFGLNYLKNQTLGKGGLAGTAAKVLTGGAGIPVTVTNWPARFGGGTPGGGAVPALVKGAPVLALAGGGAAVAAAALAYVGAHDKLLDVGLTEKSNPLIKKTNDDVRAGRLRETHGWGTFKSLFSMTPGLERVTDPADQQRAAAEYARAHPAQVKNDIKIEIHPDRTVVTESGTRSTEAMVRRVGGTR